MNWTEVSTKKLLAVVAGLFVITIAIFITLSVKDSSLDKDDELNRLVHQEVQNKTHQIEYLKESLEEIKKDQTEISSISAELDKKKMVNLDSMMTGLATGMDEREFVKTEFKIRTAFFSPLSAFVDFELETGGAFDLGFDLGYEEDIYHENQRGFEIQRIFHEVFKAYFPYSRFTRTDQLYYGGVIQEDILDLRGKYNLQEYRRLKDKFIAQLIAWKGALEQNEKKTENLIKTNEEKLTQIKKEIEVVRNNDLNRTIIKYVLPAFAVTVLLIMLIPVFLQSKNGEVYTFYNSKVMYKIITVFLLIGVIMILGIGGAISKEVLGTLLGGISAYVLNGSGKKAPEVEEE